MCGVLEDVVRQQKVCVCCVTLSRWMSDVHSVLSSAALLSSCGVMTKPSFTESVHLLMVLLFACCLLLSQHYYLFLRTLYS